MAAESESQVNVVAYDQNWIPKAEKNPFMPTNDPGDHQHPAHPPSFSTIEESGDSEGGGSSKNSLAGAPPTKTFSCALCPYKAFQAANLLRHMGYIHKTERQFKCAFCSLRFVTSGALVQHMQTHTGEKPYKCLHPNCEFSGAISGNLKAHQRVHTQEKNFECQICHNKFTTPRSVRVHMQIHEDLKPFSCTLCPYRSCQKVNVQSHMIKFHSTQRPFKCPENGCEYGAKIKYHLESLLKTYRQQKNQKCPHCPYTCITATAMRIHVRRHAGEKPYACPMCGFKCRTNSALASHIATHTGEKHFPCRFPKCDYVAVNNYTLKIRHRSHTGERPFPCKFCQYCAKQRPNLRNHIRSVHSISNKRGKKSVAKHKKYLVVHYEHLADDDGEMAEKFLCKICALQTANATHPALHYDEDHEKPMVLLERI